MLLLEQVAVPPELGLHARELIVGRFDLLVLAPPLFSLVCLKSQVFLKCLQLAVQVIYLLCLLLKPDAVLLHFLDRDFELVLILKIGIHVLLLVIDYLCEPLVFLLVKFRLLNLNHEFLVLVLEVLVLF